MSAARILIAGIGNIFLGDDAFGVEVAKRLAIRPLPAGVRVVDFGIRGIDLTYALLEDYQLVILVDAVQRGGKPGDLYVIEPLLESAGAMQTHEMAPAKALAAAKAMGAALTNVVIVGCEPESFGSDDEPQMGLSRMVERAVNEAVALIEAMAAKGLAVALHELGITQEILEIVTQRAQEQKVKRVVLEIGKLSCVLPDAIRFCFDLCAEGTIAEGAELEIIQPPGRGCCRQCGAEVVLHAVIARCACGSSDIEWLSGEELRIKTMEIA